jgi:tRNA (guanine-N7-)-methyltransferase
VLIATRREQLGATLASIVPPNASFVWEVGCGHGHFLTAYAAAHPASLCIGIDLASDRIGRGMRKLKRARLENLHFLHAGADDFLAALPANVHIASLFILFPDPWPKRRHHKHRLLTAEFLSRTAHHVARGGRLHFRTDFEPYFLETTALLRERSDWQLADEPWPFELATVFQERAENFQSLIAVRQ